MSPRFYTQRHALSLAMDGYADGVSDVSVAISKPSGFCSLRHGW